MGPIFDQHGVEQGGCNSSDFYKLYNNDLLKILQSSGQGVHLGSKLTVSAIGQADDIVLASNDIYMLYNLLLLTLDYCKRFCIKLSAGKTKLLKFSAISTPLCLNPVVIDSKVIEFSGEAEHVGVVRSTCGNIPNLMNRTHCSDKAINSILACGLARAHRSNPAACIRVMSLYSTPVLLSGLASLVMNQSETNIINQYHKNKLRCYQKLHEGTPQSFIYFMAGCLPATALLHLRQFSLFGMICRLPGDPLHQHAQYILTISKHNNPSWFTNIRKRCLQYDLPHPLSFLESPPSKYHFKKLIKSKVVQYWERKLREEASLMSSLVHFKPELLSLTRPHPVWWTAGSNPYEVSKAIVQCRMLSGRYRTQKLSSHWSEYGDSSCPSPFCTQVVESLEHILLHCPSYALARANIQTKVELIQHTAVASLVTASLSRPPEYLLQFLLDASVLQETRSLVQLHGENTLFIIFNITRTWCYSVHRDRLKLLEVMKSDSVY